jgi:hypothetical protein
VPLVANLKISERAGKHIDAVLLLTAPATPCFTLSTANPSDIIPIISSSISRWI